MSKLIDLNRIERMSDEKVRERVAELEKEHKDLIERDRRNMRNNRILREVLKREEMVKKGEI